MISTKIKTADNLVPELKTFIEQNIRPNIIAIDVFRKKVLQSVAEYLAQKKLIEEQANVIFICTHNSRRSQLSQVWAQIAAYHFGIENIYCFSGGTEVTAFFPSAVLALATVGVKVVKEDKNAKNPKYHLYFSENEIAVTAFSKLYNDSNHNPVHDFCAVMTCSHAEKNCPLVYGADCRFALYYEDPKIADGTLQQKEVYAKRSLQIATEMFYLMSQVARKINNQAE